MIANLQERQIETEKDIEPDYQKSMLSEPCKQTVFVRYQCEVFWFRIDGQADKTNKRPEVIVYLRQRESHRNGEP